MTGAEVARLARDQQYASGAHTLTWDAVGVAAGVYAVRVTAAGASQTVRVAVVR